MILKIKYLGHSSFLVESHDGIKVITDPFNDTLGYRLPEDLKADIVLISHSHAYHSCSEAVVGKPAIVQGEGYRELGWVKIRGIRSFHDKVKGEKYGSNTIFCWDQRAVRFCHLGDLGHTLSSETVENIGFVDVLFLPVGGKSVLDIEQADRVMNSINCKYVVPMHYRTDYYLNAKNSLSDFIRERENVVIANPKDEFIIDRENIGIKDKKILIMEYVDGQE